MYIQVENAGLSLLICGVTVYVPAYVISTGVFSKVYHNCIKYYVTFCYIEGKFPSRQNCKMVISTFFSQAYLRRSIICDRILFTISCTL